ncbi:hypothetical protein GOBAR_AA34141 [Gossypium barbadense]|uniref:Uncharacterized protein n=1 Tax=Gossypium barbadense TaxID=3634 RepID=A0A2P5W649_GOSBA|nr:hypothetical protein GOBAR_AA34141 [Gossypium barbadense]
MSIRHHNGDKPFGYSALGSLYASTLTKQKESTTFGGASWKWWRTWRPIPYEAAAQLGPRVSAPSAEVWAIWAVLGVGWDLIYLVIGLGFQVLGIGC